MVRIVRLGLSLLEMIRPKLLVLDDACNIQETASLLLPTLTLLRFGNLRELGRMLQSLLEIDSELRITCGVIRRQSSESTSNALSDLSKS